MNPDKTLLGKCTNTKKLGASFYEHPTSEICNSLGLNIKIYFFNNFKNKIKAIFFQEDIPGKYKRLIDF